jgi:hypothetical protein
MFKLAVHSFHTDARNSNFLEEMRRCHSIGRIFHQFSLKLRVVKCPLVFPYSGT